MIRVAVFGATSAIAAATARLYAAEGAAFFLVGRNAERLESVAADLKARGASSVTTVAADLNETERHGALTAAAVEALGGLDVALLAQGVLPDQRECEDDARQALAAVTANFTAPAALLTELAKVFERQGRGAIGVIGSVAGDRGRQSNYVYGAAKGGLGVFTQGLRHRLGRAGVSVTLIKPGFVDTPMTAGMAKGGPLWATPEKVAEDIRRGLDNGDAVVYTLWFWRFIMLIVRFLPDRLFARTRL